ncbi:suppressor APC domain-containing protein 2 [Drosophila albomicans]|uniref:Suppressor APC domain-containing protein 2 n=1 Tax=Drosophila albomicans TaxID=7291 RepID=A0A6P8Z3B3_DROAB|nr:suppressor APC domain-containing protein 2 [Drosophila albomicans]
MLSNGTCSKSGSLSSLDALPKQFVLSMKKLFDILDDKHSGYVRYTDIEKGWQDDGSKGLPQGVLDSLRRVTPPSGLLSFERFCAGLKLCLLRNQQQAQEKLAKPPRPPSAPQLLGLSLDTTLTPSVAPTAKVRPRSQLTLSTPPSLSPELERDEDYGTPAPPPPKPPRQPVSTSQQTPPTSSLAKADIRNALQNWQLSLMHSERTTVADNCGKQKILKTAREQFEHRGSADGGSSSASATDYALGGLSLALPPKKSSKRREARRHTLQHGIDYNMLKRLKHLEEQRELLLFGLDGVEKARDFYMQQVLNVQEQIKYFGRLGTRFDQWSELQQERLNYQRGRVLEANRSLAILTETWEHGGYPLHINLALPRKSLQHFNYKDNYAANEADLLACEKQALMSELYEQHQHQQQQQHQQHQQQQQHTQFHNLRGTRTRNLSDFVLSQPSPVSQSSAGLGDADVVY